MTKQHVDVTSNIQKREILNREKYIGPIQYQLKWGKHSFSCKFNGQWTTVSYKDLRVAIRAFDSIYKKLITSHNGFTSLSEARNYVRDERPHECEVCGKEVNKNTPRSFVSTSTKKIWKYSPNNLAIVCPYGWCRDAYKKVFSGEQDMINSRLSRWMYTAYNDMGYGE